MRLAQKVQKDKRKSKENSKHLVLCQHKFLDDLFLKNVPLSAGKKVRVNEKKREKELKNIMLGHRSHEDSG